MIEDNVEARHWLSNEGAHWWSAYFGVVSAPHWLSYEFVVPILKVSYIPPWTMQWTPTLEMELRTLTNIQDNGLFVCLRCAELSLYVACT